MTYTDPSDRSTRRQVEIYQGYVFISPLPLGNHSGLCIQLVQRRPHRHRKTGIFGICTHTFVVQLYDFPQFLTSMS